MGLYGGSGAGRFFYYVQLHCWDCPRLSSATIVIWGWGEQIIPGHRACPGYAQQLEQQFLLRLRQCFPCNANAACNSPKWLVMLSLLLGLETAQDATNGGKGNIVKVTYRSLAHWAEPPNTTGSIHRVSLFAGQGPTSCWWECLMLLQGVATQFGNPWLRQYLTVDWTEACPSACDWNAFSRAGCFAMAQLLETW